MNPRPLIWMATVAAVLSVTVELAQAQAVQSLQTSATEMAPVQGPKTRAQVRAELAHAREDGTIPRYGNPDPYGPGGKPNFAGQPAAHSW
jgi:Domain of unknown function (DUF4148)